VLLKLVVWLRIVRRRRERISVVFAALLGVALPRERLTPRKWLGISAIGLGLIATKGLWTPHGTMFRATERLAAE
jgi:hypothetical protein